MNHRIRSLGLLFLLAGVVPALPARAVTVSVAPAETTVACSDQFAVRILTDDFSDLKGFEIVFSFDPAKIQLLGADPGDVLTASGNPFSAYLVPDVAPPDTAWYDAAVLVGSSSGPGILAFLRFKALAVGQSPVQCELVDFRDSNNVQTLPACVSGLVHITTPTLARPTTWGRVKLIYR